MRRIDNLKRVNEEQSAMVTVKADSRTLRFTTQFCIEAGFEVGDKLAVFEDEGEFYVAKDDEGKILTPAHTINSASASKLIGEEGRAIDYSYGGLREDDGVDYHRLLRQTPHHGAASPNEFLSKAEERRSMRAAGGLIDKGGYNVQAAEVSTELEESDV